MPTIRRIKLFPVQRVILEYADEPLPEEAAGELFARIDAGLTDLSTPLVLVSGNPMVALPLDVVAHSVIQISNDQAPVADDACVGEPTDDVY